MDVYGGGVGPVAERLRSRLGAVLAGVGAEHQEQPAAPGALVRVWSDGTGESVHVDTDDVEVLFDGYLNHHGQASLADHLPVLARRIIDERRVLAGRETGIFNVAVLDKRTGDVHLANDPGGLLPLVHTRTSDGFAFASHLYATARALDSAPDPEGVTTMIALGFALGSRTYFAGIDRLCPGELVTYRAAGGTVERSYPEVYFAQYVEPGPDLADELWEALVDAARPLADAGSTVGVMLSEGFDSRFVAGVLGHLGVPLETYTHATEGTQGTEIVRQVSRQLGSHHAFEFFEQGFSADLDDLRRQLILADNLHIPYWSNGARHFRSRGVDATTTGFAMDVSLGGHAMVSSSGPTRRRVLQRYREILQQDVGRMQDQQMEDLCTELLSHTFRMDEAWTTNRMHRFLAPELVDVVLPHVPSVPDMVHAEQDRVRAGTQGLPSQVLHRYFLENRARKYSFGQEQTLRVDNSLVEPCYEPAFMRLLSSVPPRHRIHHRVYLQLLRRHLPELSRINSGAHALPPRYPRLLLETSRFAWKAHESRLLDRYMASKGQQDIHQLRMVLVTEKTARQAERFAIQDVIDRPSSPINGPSLQLTVDKIRRHEIRVFLPALYLGLELTEVFDRL